MNTRSAVALSLVLALGLLLTSQSAAAGGELSCLEDSCFLASAETLAPKKCEDNPTLPGCQGREPRGEPSPAPDEPTPPPTEAPTAEPTRAPVPTSTPRAEPTVAPTPSRTSTPQPRATSTPAPASPTPLGTREPIPVPSAIATPSLTATASPLPSVPATSGTPPTSPAVRNESTATAAPTTQSTGARTGAAIARTTPRATPRASGPSALSEGSPRATEALDQAALAEEPGTTPTPASLGAFAGPPPTEEVEQPPAPSGPSAAVNDGPVEQARRLFRAPSGLLGQDAGGLAVALGTGAALGLAGIVLGVWIWQVRRE